MDPHSIFAISASGMSLERARAEAAALNLANAHVASAPGEAGYMPMRAVAQAAAPFADHMFAPRAQLVATGSAPRQVHEPGHPLADAKGFVTYPGVDPATEMVTMMDATRAYEANVAAMNTARAMALKALEIGGNS